jgi:hypothetical protein
LIIPIGHSPAPIRLPATLAHVLSLQRLACLQHQEISTRRSDIFLIAQVRGAGRSRQGPRKARPDDRLRCTPPDNGSGDANTQAHDFGSREACLRSFRIVKRATPLQRAGSHKPTHAPGSNMPSDSSGLLESLAAGLFCIVALAAIHRNDGDAPTCQAERVAMGPQRAAAPVRPGDAAIEAEIKDMLLHD